MKAILFKRFPRLSGVVVGFAGVSLAKAEHDHPEHRHNAFGNNYIPVDKLSCHRKVQSGSKGEVRRNTQPVVLVACGSFNPPTCAHLRVLEVVREEFMRRGVDVYGAYLSPVHNAYKKKGLEPGNHRLAMCYAAAEDSGFVMVDPWEFCQETYTRTLFVLESVERRLQESFESSDMQQYGNEGELSGKHGLDSSIRSVLVCGSDLIESMCDENVWDQSLLEQLLSRHGVACVVRPGSDLQQVLEKEGTLPFKYRENIMIVQNNVLDDVSSTVVREKVRQGQSIQGLVPDSVREYIEKFRLYTT